MPRHPLMLSALAACTPVALSYMQRAALPRNAVLTLASRERRTKAGPRAVATGDATENAPAISEYDHTAMEAKWQQHWEAQNTFATRRREGKEKKYVLDMFPYPSGAGLHVGHPEGYTASDIMARYWRMKDYDVLHPMGWDSFGLPAEQHAINTGTHPEETTKENIANFKRHSMVKATPRQRPGSAPAPPQGAPGGTRQLGTPRVRPSQWDPSHRLGGSSEPPPKDVRRDHNL